MIELLKGREFQLWEYRVSHGTLLIRSPRKEDEYENIDIMFWSVVYMEVRRDFGEITIETPNQEELNSLNKLEFLQEYQKYIEGDFADKVTILVSGGNRYCVVAHHRKIKSNACDILDYPFDVGISHHEAQNVHLKNIIAEMVSEIALYKEIIKKEKAERGTR